ncbi:PrgI family protein [Candidatus Nomurabacteria bacterium]|nr:PrgI family protein [Candidatus Nomurabacteria bacterium]
MQFKVPQFIDVEDKVVGPLSFRQFAYLAGGTGLVYLSFRLLPILIALPVAVALGALAAALAFMRYNEKPFVNVLESFIRFHTKSKLYLWRKQSPKIPKKPSEEGMRPLLRDTLNESKLKTLTRSLDTLDN